MAALSGGTPLRRIYLSKAELYSHGFEALGEALERNSTPCELELYNCLDDSKELSHTARALHVNSTLRVLEQTQYDTTVEGEAEEFEAALRVNDTLEDLKLTVPTGDDAVTLISALAENRGLRTLVVRIDDRSNGSKAAAVADAPLAALASNRTLESLGPGRPRLRKAAPRQTATEAALQRNRDICERWARRGGLVAWRATLWR